MGYMRHHAIIVTSWNGPKLKAARKKAKSLGLIVSKRVPSLINGIETFVVMPDGSKEGWQDSNDGDLMREEFIEHLEGYDGYLDWAEIQYGDDDGKNKILNSSGVES